jgi:hypothetical protein
MYVKLVTKTKTFRVNSAELVRLLSKQDWGDEILSNAYNMG